MWCNGYQPHVYHLLTQNKVVADSIYQHIQHGVRTAASQVAKRLLIYPPRKGAMEEIYDSEDYISDRERQGLFVGLWLSVDGQLPEKLI